MIMAKEDIEIIYSKANMASYGMGSLMREFILMGFNTFVFYYYEIEVGLNVWFIGIGFILFAIWNAINDPLLGYLTNRPFKFTKKWGRRYPWILLGGFPMGICYFLIFYPPQVDPQTIEGTWILFGWLLFVTCLFDTVHSLYFVNFQALFPDKFRSVEERRKATGFQIIIGVVGVALGAIVPPLIINFGDLTSYAIQGIVVCIIAVVTMFLAIPGIKEDQSFIDRYLESHAKEPERISFIKVLKSSFKQRSFVAFLVLYVCYQVLVPSMTASIPYVVRFILRLEASATTLLMAAMLIGTIVSTPFWVKLAQKTNDNGKVMLISGLLMGVLTFPMIFLDSYIGFLVNMLFWGISLGGFWAMIFPVMSDIIDESVVILEKREEGIITGIQQFFGRLGLIVQALSFALAHSLTGFIEGATSYEELAILSPNVDLAIWGIHVHLALVPMICILFGSLVFWKWYGLKSENVKANQLAIRQLKL